MLNRILIAFGMIALAIGAYDAFTSNHPAMAVLLGLATLALAIPVFVDRK